MKQQMIPTANHEDCQLNLNLETTNKNLQHKDKKTCPLHYCLVSYLVSVKLLYSLPELQVSM